MVSPLKLHGRLAVALAYQAYRRTLQRRVNLLSLGFITRFWPSEVA